MAEVESLCDRIAILNDGTLFFLGSVAELSAKLGKRYTIHIKTAQGDKSFVSDNIAETMLALLEDFRLRNIEVLDIKIDQGNLEQHFMNIARGNIK